MKEVVYKFGACLIGVGLLLLPLGCEKLSNKTTISGLVTEFGTGKAVQNATVKIYGETSEFGIWGTTHTTHTVGAPKTDADGYFVLVYHPKKDYSRMWMVASSPEHFTGPEYNISPEKGGDINVSCNVFAKAHLRFEVPCDPGKHYSFIQTNRSNGGESIGQHYCTGGQEYTEWMEVFGSWPSNLNINVMESPTGPLTSFYYMYSVEALDSMTFLLPF